MSPIPPTGDHHPRARAVFTDRSHGDLSVALDAHTLRERRGGLNPRPWTWLSQVHGAEVVTVDGPGDHAGAEADAAVTSVPGAVLAVHTADCAPVIFESEDAVGVAHVGWRGLTAGVVEATVEAMARLGHPPRRALIGPHIRPACYEFGPADLDLVAERCGPSVRSTTSGGAPALDLAAGVRALISDRGLVCDDVGTCTACSPIHWSHRARGDRGRQAALVWIDP